MKGVTQVACGLLFPAALVSCSATLPKTRLSDNDVYMMTGIARTSEYCASQGHMEAAHAERYDQALKKLFGVVFYNRYVPFQVRSDIRYMVASKPREEMTEQCVELATKMPGHIASLQSRYDQAIKAESSPDADSTQQLTVQD